MPYLEISKQETAEETTQNIEMPELTGITIKDAKKILKELGLEVEINGEESEEGVVIEQLPKKGIQVNTGTKVVVYTN